MVKWRVNDGMAQLLHELASPPPTPHGDQRIFFPLADGWHEKSKAGVERFLFGAATKIETTDFDFGEETIILGDATAATLTGTLPAAATSKDRIYFCKKIEPVDSGKKFTIAAQGGESIDHASFFDITVRDESIVVVSDGTQWQIIAQK